MSDLPWPGKYRVTDVKVMERTRTRWSLGREGENWTEGRREERERKREEGREAHEPEGGKRKASVLNVEK